MKRIITGIILTMFYSLCLADQAAWITKQQADAAVKILSKAGTVRYYCEPCGDKGYTSEKVGSVKSVMVDVEWPGKQDFEVSINDKPVDLAYVYVLQGGKWMNLAMLLKIEVGGVSRVMPADVKELAGDDVYRSGLKDFEMEDDEEE